MARYRIVHRTDHRYDRMVTVGRTVARLLPRALPHQEVLAASLTVEPTPSHSREHVDGFGNRVTSVVVDQPHDTLVVTATSEVELHDRRAEPASDTAWDQPWEAAVDATASDTSEDGLLARTCRLDSPLVERSPELHAFGARDFAPGRPLAEAATALTRRICEELELVPGATGVATRVLDVLCRRRGVNQDFAHLLLGALRAQGLGARYVSGFIETGPPPGQPRMAGTDASHAWVGLYVGGGQWVDLDPANGLVRPERHVTVGWGRDHTDVTPLRGIVYGPPTDQHLTVSVDVVRTG